MMDIKKAKQEFKEYISNYDINNKKTQLKIRHIERVANIAKKLAENLQLSKNDVELAELIGLLHDIGRFEQIKQYNTFVDEKSINHGELGVKILFEEGLIRKFIEDSKYDEIIKIAILNHNRSPKDIKTSNEKELLHSKIIRDSDKIDIINMLTFEDKEASWEKADLSEDEVSDEIYYEFMEKQCINYKNRKTSADILVSHFAYIYDFNYKYSLQIIKENEYYKKIYERFNFKNKKTEKRINEIYNKVEKYLENI